MLEDIEEQEIRLLMYQIMLVLFDHGVTEVNVGGLMRVLGVENEHAQEHDDELIVLDQRFAKYVETMVAPRHSDHTIH